MMTNSSVDPMDDEIANLHRRLLGQLLLQRSLVSDADLEKALAFQQQYNGRLGGILVRIGALSEDSLLPVLAEQLGLTLLGQEDFQVSPTKIEETIRDSGLELDWFIDQQTLLWEMVDGRLCCASRNPINGYRRDILSAAFPDHEILWSLARSQDIENILKGLQQNEIGAYGDEAAHLKELAEEAPVVELVNNVLAQSIDERASDVHMEPSELEFQVRYRIDGVLHERLRLPRARFEAVASRIKLVSGMDIAERRLPQDGRISMRASGVEMDIRVSAVPGIHGESIVMRLLPKERSELSLRALGMESDHLEQFTRWIAQPYGIVLITGPTGSGKSTTLYAALDAINDHSKKIITVEDPVEFKMRGVTQIQTHAEIGYDFARALRAILRQDPDIIMIGEIRDEETAGIAVQSSLTGHLVLSSLHTNDAPGAFSRLVDMGVEPFLVASSVRAVQAQRLVRALCRTCMVPDYPSDAIQDLLTPVVAGIPHLANTEAMFHKQVGCPACHGTGYRGRLGIYEFIEMTPEIQAAIMEQRSAATLIDIARRQGYRNLREDGLLKARRGLTSVDEVLRVTGLAAAD